MKYEALDKAILQLVAAASEERLRVFGSETIVRLVRDERLDLVTELDLDDRGRRALSTACRQVLTADPAQLRGYLTQVDEGVLTDGDMDFPLLNLLDALEQWTTYLETGSRDEIYQLAIRSIEQIDSEVDADTDDFLAPSEMAAEYERIRRGLSHQP